MGFFKTMTRNMKMAQKKCLTVSSNFCDYINV
jgi:hypothetical protein